MKLLRFLSLVAALSVFGVAQQGNQAIASTSSQVVVPRLIRFTGQVRDGMGSVGITFTLHKSQQDNAALWIETQNVKLDAAGKYTVLLGATKPDGIPTELFTSGEAQWLSVKVEGQPEQPRVLLVSVPYAMKAAEAETLAGHAATDFVTSDKLNSTVAEQVQQAHFNTVEGKKNAVNGVINTTATTFTDSNAGSVVTVYQNGSGQALVANAKSGTAITGNSNATTGATIGVLGQSASTSGIGLRGFASAGTGVTIGLFGSAASVSGTAIAATESAASGFTTGLQATVSSTNGIAAVIQNKAGGKIFSGRSGSGETEVFSVDGSGNVTTSGTFTGNGTGLSGVAQLGSGDFFNSYLDAHESAGPGNAAVLGWGTSGSVGTFGNSDSGYGLQGVSNTGFGVYAQVKSPAAGSAGVLGFTGSGFSATYTSEVGLANAGVWADNSNAGVGVPVALFATADDGYGAALITNGADFPALFVDNTGGAAIGAQAASGYGISASSGSGTAVYGMTSGSGNGVEGIANGLAGQNAGVLGIGNTESNSYSSYDIYAGVWGDTGTDSTTVSPAWAIGVLGTADDSHAGVFLNNSSAWTTMYIRNSGSGGSGAPEPGLFATLNAATRTGACGIGGNGDLTCTGQLKTLATTGGGARTVETYAMHSPENWMEDFGSGTMQNGVAMVTIDPAFAETVSGTAEYHVFLTPKGDSKGLYVARETATSFEVRESGGGTSSLSFDYRIVAKRRGYEGQRLTDVTQRLHAEQQALHERIGPRVQPAARPGPSPLTAKSNATGARKNAGLTPRRHVAVAPAAETRPATPTHP